MYLISKQFEFSYGHRVWSQELSDPNALCRCRWLHGHNGKLTIELRAPELQNDMVLDYNELGFMKSFVDIYLDHKMVLDFDDPIAANLNLRFTLGSSCFGFQVIRPVETFEPNPYWELDHPRHLAEKQEMDARKELYDSLILFKGVPTSENFCKAIYDGVAERVAGYGIGVNAVKFKETDKTEAVYMR